MEVTLPLSPHSTGFGFRFKRFAHFLKLWCIPSRKRAVYTRDSKFFEALSKSYPKGYLRALSPFHLNNIIHTARTLIHVEQTTRMIYSHGTICYFFLFFKWSFLVVYISVNYFSRISAEMTGNKMTRSWSSASGWLYDLSP